MAKTHPDELMHYGVKGQKWGVRKDRNSKSAKRAAKRAVNKMNRAKKKAERAKASEKRRATIKTRWENAQIKKNNSVKKMTNEQIKEANERLKLQNEFERTLAQNRQLNKSNFGKSIDKIKKLLGETLETYSSRMMKGVANKLADMTLNSVFKTKPDLSKSASNVRALLQKSLEDYTADDFKLKNRYEEAKSGKKSSDKDDD